MDIPPPKPIRLFRSRVRHSQGFALFIVLLILGTYTKEADYPAFYETMEWVGYLLVALGFSTRVFSSLYIGGRKNDQLIADGPFSVVRNPLYVGSFFAFLGIGLQSGSMVLTAIIAGSFIVYYPFVIRKEELFLTEKFGESYRAYQRSVPRWIPNVKKWHSPQELVCKPRFVLKTMRDAGLFFLAFPALEYVSQLHESGTLPFLAVLP